MSDELAADADWSIWLGAPQPALIDDYGVDVATWAQRTAPLVWQASGREPDPNGIPRLTRQLEIVGDREFPEDEAWILKWLHLPDPNAIPLAVMLWLDDIDGEADGGWEHLSDVICRVDRPTNLEPPIIEPFDSQLGPARRSLAYSAAAPSDEVYAWLSYAFRTTMDGVDTIVRLWTAWHPARVLAALDDIDVLAASLHIVTD